jgi:hypothetical protein
VLNANSVSGLTEMLMHVKKEKNSKIKKNSGIVCAGVNLWDERCF